MIGSTLDACSTREDRSGVVVSSEASSAEAQADLTVIRARAALVRTRTMWSTQRAA